MSGNVMNVDSDNQHLRNLPDHKLFMFVYNYLSTVEKGGKI